MGCTICKNPNDIYFNAFFKNFKISKVTDQEYLMFIERYIVNKINFYKKLSNSNISIQKNINIQNTSTSPNKQQEAIISNILKDDASSNDFLEQNNNDNTNIKEKLESSNEINLIQVQDNLNKYMDELAFDIVENFCVYNKDLIQPTQDEIFPDKDEISYLNEYLVKKEINSFFEFYFKIYRKQGKVLQFICSLLFFTQTSYKNIAKYMNKLYLLFFNIEILQEEHNVVSINLSLIKEACEIYIRMSSINCVEYVSALIPGTSKTEFTEYYKEVFSDDIINFFVENYFEYTFSQTISLAYFVKAIYVKIENNSMVRNSLIESYNENKNLNMERMN